jgi:hypothetical protein
VTFTTSALPVQPLVALLPHAPTISTLLPHAPTISSVSLTNKRFRVASQPTAISAKKTRKPVKAPQGTSFRFTLSAAAGVQIAIARSVPGLRSGHACLAPSARLKRKHARLCTRTVTAGTLTRSNEPLGADSISFSGRIGSLKLPPGAYQAVLTASNAGGAAHTARLAFTVVS